MPALPLRGRRVLVTRARAQASMLAAELEREGAEVVVVPTIELAPPLSYCGLDAALTTLNAYDWLLFTSANAVEAFAARAHRLKLSPVARRVGVIGPATAKAVVAAGVAETIDLQPERFVAEALVEALRPFAPGRSMLVVRAAEARDVLVDGLTAAGAVVTVAVAYRNVIPDESAERLRNLFQHGIVLDAALFTSASSAANLQALLQVAEVKLPKNIVLGSIGPVTSQAMRDLGWQVAFEARQATLRSLVEGMTTYFEAGASELFRTD